MTTLSETLTLIAEQLSLDAAKLRDYAALDMWTGWDNGAGEFPIGSLWAVEGKTLYALIRVLKPETVVELGTHYGASSTHILEALRANGSGQLTSVDIQESAGSMIPAHLRERLAQVHHDAVTWLAAQPAESIDIIFEDLFHNESDCEDVGKLAKIVLKPGGVLVAHDALHFVVGEGVQNGFTAAGLDYKMYLSEPSDCGLLVWQKPAAPVVKVSKKRKGAV